MSETVVTPALLRQWTLPTPEGDKHGRGTVLVVGGAAATAGAVLLTGVAALRSGSGVLQVCCAPAVAASVAVGFPEAMVVGWDDEQRLGDLASAADVTVIGPGLDDIDGAAHLLDLVVHAGGDLVVDAYALGALSHRPRLLHKRERPAVLTPNSTEAEVLGADPADFETAVADLARRYRTVVALRGHIAAPDGRSWRDEGGDVGLGTAGSGDVFAGLVGGLLARGADPEQAACWAAHLHAAAGQRLAASLGRTGFLARELVDEAPRVLAALQT